MLSALRNLGPASVQMLQQAGIETEAQLREVGAVVAYVKVQQMGLKPSLNLLWALEGALCNTDWKEVAETERLRLLLALEDYQND